MYILIAMVRLARFSADAFVDAAVSLVADGGPTAATVAAIARKVGAPTGSVYHRFESRAAVIAAAWIAIHASLTTRLRPMLLAGRGLDAALALPTWAREDATRARFLLLNEADTLFEDAPPDRLRQEIRQQEEALDSAFRAYLSTGKDSNAAVDPEMTARARFLIFDGPIALIRPHLLAGERVPRFVDAIIGDMHGAIGVCGTRNTQAGQVA